MSKLTICGGGNAAHVLFALAGHIGWEVDVFAPLADEAERLPAGISVRGGILANYGHKTVRGRPRLISATPAEVIPGSELFYWRCRPLLTVPPCNPLPTIWTAR